MTSRAILAACAIASIALSACENSPTQPAPLAPPPAPQPAPAPPPPPPPPPATGQWLGFIGTESGGFVAISGLPTMTQNFPSAINDAGQVAGQAFLGSVRRAFLWSNEKGMEELGVLPNGFESTATAINADGEVVGYDYPFSGNARAFRWSRALGMIEILGLPYTCLSTRALGISKSGDVVGMCLVNSQQGVFRPFRWSANFRMEDLGTLDNDLGGVATAINDRGEIVGYSTPSSIYDDARGAMWNGAGKIVQVGNCAVDWCYTLANAINNSGDVVGTSNSNAFVRWRDGSLRDIGGLSGARYSTAVGINDAGEIVGVSYPVPDNGGIRSFIWTAAGGMRELRVSGKTEFLVTAINDKGQIVGYAR